MSDIFIKTGASGNTGWRRMSNLFIKTAGSGSTGWRAAAGIWIRQAANWLKVWPLSGVFATRPAWVGPDSTTAYADRLTSSSRIRIGSNYYGNNAQWDPNGWTIASYSYAWKYYSTNDGLSSGVTFSGESGTGSGWTSGGTGQDVLPLSTWDNSTNNETYDRKYIRFEVTANATNSTYSGSSTSPYIQIIRRVPVNITTSLSSYNPVVGTQITYSSTWDTTEARKAESFRTTVVWYRNSTNSTSGGTQVGTGTTYTPASTDIGNYLYVVETRFNSGTDYDLGLTTGVSATAISDTTVADVNYQAAGNQRRITLPSNFTSGTTVYVSTNGYINWGGNDPGGSISIPTSGITLAPLSADLRQGSTASLGGGLWTFADSTSFTIRWRGAYYSDTLQSAEYQIKLYWNQSYADVYFVSNGLTSAVPSTTAVQNGSTVFRTWSQSTSQSSTLLDVSTMTRNTLRDGVDDNNTPIVAAVPVAPSGGSAYLGNSSQTSISTIVSGGIIYLWKTDATGSPTPTVSWVWQRNDGGIGGNQFRTVQTGGSSYTTGSGDVNYSIRAVVTWTNGVPSDQVVNTSSVSVTAGTYTVTWNAALNGGTGGGTTTQNAGVAHTAPSASKNSFLVSYSGNGNTGGSAPTASQATYVFNGYYDTPEFDFTSGPIAIGGSFTPSSSITMYGRWSTTSNSVTLPGAGTLTKTGSTFDGWNTNTSGTGTSYNAGDSFTPSAATTLYAKWKLDTYTVSYNKNTTDTVSNMPSDQTKTYNVNLTLSSNTPTRSGYTFAGWNTNSSGTGTNYSAGGTYSENAAVTLYAKWTVASATRTLSYNKNTTATVDNMPASQTGTDSGSGATITINSTAPKRIAWVFGGWYLNTGGTGTKYNPGDSITITSDTTLYARWIAMTQPGAVAPSLQFQRNNTNGWLRWYCNYPTVTGNFVSGSVRMQCQLNNEANTTTLLADFERYPGVYNVGGVDWEFKAGVDGQVSDIPFTTASRFGRVRVLMTGTDGYEYAGTWSSWI